MTWLDIQNKNYDIFEDFTLEIYTIPVNKINSFILKNIVIIYKKYFQSLLFMSSKIMILYHLVSNPCLVIISNTSIVTTYLQDQSKLKS